MRLSVFALSALVAVSGCTSASPLGESFKESSLNPKSDEIVAVVMFSGGRFAKTYAKADGDFFCKINSMSFATFRTNKPKVELEFYEGWPESYATPYTLNKSNGSVQYILVKHKGADVYGMFGLAGAIARPADDPYVQSEGPYAVNLIEKEIAVKMLEEQRESICSDAKEVPLI